ncbi:MAG: mechanosensitive ion channel [Acidobacteria bacterium]|nr:mechanosensitive ion channel [Acidobacteriota bacterium]
MFLSVVSVLAQEKSPTPISSPNPSAEISSQPSPVTTPTPTQSPTPALTPSLTISSGTPVIINNKTLFRIREKAGDLTPNERAELVISRIQTIAFNPFVSEVKVTIEDFEEYTDIKVKETLLLTISNSDALAEGKPRQDLAKDYASIIQQTLLELKADYNNKTILIGILLTIAATFLLVLFLKLENVFFSKLEDKLELTESKLLRPIKVQKLELLTLEQVRAILLILLQVARTALVILALIFYLPIIFSFFPWTRSLSTTFFNYILILFSKLWQTIAEYLPSLFILSLVIIITFYSIRLARFIFKELAKGTLKVNGFEREWAKPTYRIVSFLMFCCGLAIAFPYFPGAGSPAFQGISIFLGVLFSLASSSAISNIIAGAILTYTKAFRLGDRVKIADTMGDVVEKTLLVTRLRTIKKVEISIPNSVVLNSYIINYSTAANKEGVVLSTSVTIGYDAPWRKIHDLLITAAKMTPGILEIPAPFVLQTALNDFYVCYEINAYTEKANEMEFIYSSLHQNIQDRFNDAGMEIMSPHYTSLRDGNTIAIPEKYREKDYQPNNFKVKAVITSPNKSIDD